jgi:hypothetical protein
MILQILLILTISFSGVLSSSSGASTLACTDLTPRHGTNTPQTSAMPIDMTVQPGVINAGDVVTITLQGRAFKGFIVQARILGSGEVTGSFEFTSEMRTMDCRTLPSNSVATHINNEDKTSVVLRWRAPTNFNSAFIQVNFFYSIVESFPVFWNNGISRTTVFINNPAFS